MEKRIEFVKLPTLWIREGRLNNFIWSKGKGAANIAALQVLVVLAHNRNAVTGVSRATYEELKRVTGRSGTLVSDGLERLLEEKLIARIRRSEYTLDDGDTRWGKLPWKSMYNANGEIPAFVACGLRVVAELDAMKFFMQVVSGRDNGLNAALMSYETITKYTGIPRARINKTHSWLAGNDLIAIDQYNPLSSHRPPNAYRLRGIDARTHRGTVSHDGTLPEVT
jgi:hypothetical protein